MNNELDIVTKIIELVKNVLDTVTKIIEVVLTRDADFEFGVFGDEVVVNFLLEGS